ncbi:membrane-bound O-acyltransferase GUP1-like isoform X2 [Cicer arietinum]|uniref:Glycerol uptake protein 1-like isoform X2 n=1 Tax=Cicer arietinum TaxID=3827 RepID=A0A3Q7XY20_CICAR|nr:glycerol uptake protein 1-like isoform X2 [Cicer arietinum]
MLSFNKWLVRYMSIPLGVSRKKLLNVWVIFTFDAIWHDLEWLKTLSGNSYFVNSVLLLVQLQSLASWVVLGRVACPLGMLMTFYIKAKYTVFNICVFHPLSCANDSWRIRGANIVGIFNLS